jgi:hypothetical protein
VIGCGLLDQGEVVWFFDRWRVLKMGEWAPFWPIKVNQGEKPHFWNETK